MALKDQLFIGSVWVDSAVRKTNTTGTPVVSAADTGSGEAIPDEYTLIASAVAGGTATVTVGTESPNNPYKGRIANGVALDGVTPYKNIIPGVTLIFSNTTANGHAASVFVGLYLDTFDAFGAGAGVPGGETRHRVINDGTGATSDSKATLKTQAIQVKMVGNALQLVKPFAAGATEKEAGGGSTQTRPYVLSISGVAGAGAGKTASVSIDGVLIPAGQVIHPDGSTSSGAGLKAVNPAEVYRIATPHLLEDLEFALDAGCANGDVANILIFQSRHVQLAPEVGGVADDDEWATDDIVLTQAGQPAGEIQPAGEAFYWSRIVVPNGASPDKNPLPCNVALDAVEAGAAGWTYVAP